MTEYKKMTLRAFGAILLFAFSYLFIIALSVGFVIVCGLVGIYILGAGVNFITGIISLGIVWMGVMVLFYLLKFVFKRNVVDKSNMLELKITEHPRLNELIKQLTTEIKTTFPKKIYISPDINASVFYNSTFWSMFFPVKKNLQIGLGLVNSLTADELKAVLAHEFAHFSQKSMKVGSYVYNVNRVIYNLLYENTTYDNTITQVARSHSFLSLFSRIGIEIIKLIQLLLKKLYSVVNINYLRLSREMEFHADAIAAFVTGPTPLSDSLLRLDFSNAAYNGILNFYNEKITKGEKTENCYPQHLFAMKILAEVNRITLSDNGLPSVKLKDINKINRSQIVIKNQWASHPSDEERINRLNDLGIKEKQMANELAWVYFSNGETLQKLMTTQLFKNVPESEKMQNISLENFCTQYSECALPFPFDAIYNGFYDNHTISLFNLDETVNDFSRATTVDIAHIFDDSAIELLYRKNGVEGDINTLNYIKSGEMKINTFDFRGEKHNVNDIYNVLNELELENKNIAEEIKQIDINSFCFFYNIAQSKGNMRELKQLYSVYFDTVQECTSDMSLYTDLTNVTQFLGVTTPYNQIEANLVSVKEKEKNLKKRLNEFMQEDCARKEAGLSQEQEQDILRYIQDEQIYFIHPEYDNKAISLLMNAIHSFYSLSSFKLFCAKKDVLTYQAQLLAVTTSLSAS